MGAGLLLRQNGISSAFFGGLFGAGSEEKRKAKVLLRGIRERLGPAKAEAMWRYAHDTDVIRRRTAALLAKLYC